MAADDPAAAAGLVRGILRLAVTGDKDGMCALAESHRGRPDVLGAAVVLLGAELAAMRMDGLAEALARNTQAAKRLLRAGGG